MEVDVGYPKTLYELHNDLPFLLERMNFEKVKNFNANFHDQNEYVIDIRNLKQALNHGLVLRKVHRVIKFNQKAWLKSCIEMNRELRKKVNKHFKKCFFKLMNNSVSEKLWIM